ncbi:hypothetical protein OS493_027299 [Desmophyllum pertusum]|uniref:Uncharacterized protein n=1 Tax=Desmophyllum pertusum TaxID=174260 RepID=A0A9X0CRU3_9CNID|nr:hypothetical protein OS493_027299 [Desmophyllum pertusum]
MAKIEEDSKALGNYNKDGSQSDNESSDDLSPIATKKEKKKHRKRSSSLPFIETNHAGLWKGLVAAEERQFVNRKEPVLNLELYESRERNGRTCLGMKRQENIRRPSARMSINIVRLEEAQVCQSFIALKRMNFPGTAKLHGVDQSCVIKLQELRAQT